jgi:uncharacterized protein involved in type VI secretion and phage assembly
MGAGAMLVSGLIGGIGEILQGRQQEAMAEYNAKMQEQTAKYNAELARNAAVAEENANRARMDRMRSEQRQTTAYQQASFLKSGALMTGTPLVALAEQAGEMELDLLTAQHESTVKAQSYREQAKAGIWQGQAAANLSRYEGKAARTASYFKAGSTLLGNASSAWDIKSKTGGWWN